MSISVRKLQASDDRSTFESGNVDLDRFFHRYAGQNQFRHHIGTTYVAVDGATILGFATVAPTELAPVSALRLARLAVDTKARGRGVGSELMRAVFILALRMSDELGCVGVVVDAKEEAIPFYEKLGFVPLALVSGELGDRPQPQLMFLELGAIARS